MLGRGAVAVGRGAAKGARPGADRDGERLVTITGCSDCHSPKTFTAQGPQPDASRLFSGHPAGTKLPATPAGLIAPDRWGALTTNDLTAWSGPWGVSFATNLTPDPDTGMGSWSEEMFVQSMRTGQHLGTGRPILPPMPWYAYAAMTDEELKALFAYLRSLKPIQNAVPDPLPPPGPPPQK